MSEENILGNTPENNAPEVNTPENNAPESNKKQELAWNNIVGENGAFADNWREFLPEDIRNEKCFDSMHTFGALAKSYVHSQKALGGKKVALPDEKSSPEEWNSFYNMLGRPETPEGYTVDGVEIPEGVVLDDNIVGEFRKFAHEHGINDKTFRAAIAFDAQRAAAAMAAREKEAEAEYNSTMAQLKGEYGDKFPDVVAQCDKAMNTFGLTELFREKGLLNNYTLIRALANIGEKISESRVKAGGEPFISSSPERELEQLQSDMSGALYDREHPGHDLALKRQAELLAQIIRNRK